MKNIGITLVAIGLFTIFYAIFFSVQIFVLGREAPEIIKEEPSVLIEEDVDEREGEKEALEGDLEEESLLQIQEMIDIKNIIPLNRIINLSVATIFIMILIYAGFKIAMIGVAIIKN